MALKFWFNHLISAKTGTPKAERILFSILYRIVFPNDHTSIFRLS